jgi:hypothetical protein
VNDVEFVEVGDPADDVFEETTGLQLIQLGLFDNVVEEFPVLNVLHDEKKMAGGLDDLDGGWNTS